MIHVVEVPNSVTFSPFQPVYRILGDWEERTLFCEKFTALACEAINRALLSETDVEELVAGLAAKNPQVNKSQEQNFLKIMLDVEDLAAEKSRRFIKKAAEGLITSRVLLDEILLLDGIEDSFRGEEVRCLTLDGYDAGIEADSPDSYGLKVRSRVYEQDRTDFGESSPEWQTSQRLGLPYFVYSYELTNSKADPVLRSERVHATLGAYFNETFSPVVTVLSRDYYGTQAE